MMPSLPQLLLVAAVVLILFKSKDIPRLFSDLGSGIRAFRKNIKEDEELIELKS